jgi:membrane protease subunit (stomatin/prohibitin family)
VKFQRLVPRKTTVQAFAEHLVYVMNCMHERESSYVNGIGLIADLSDFTVSNFSIPFMSKFLMLVQGRQVPVKVESVMFLNPPRWFGAVWGVLKTMMSSDFLKTKVHLISFHELFTRHLNPGAPEFLTNDIYLGQRPANDIVAEFIDERKHIESHKILLGHR